MSFADKWNAISDSTRNNDNNDKNGLERCHNLANQNSVIFVINSGEIENDKKAPPSNILVAKVSEGGDQSQGSPPQPIADNPPFMCSPDHPVAAIAMLCHVPGIGDFWIVADEAAGDEMAGDGLSCLLPEDLVFIAGGATKHDRFNRLLGRVSLNHPVVQGILEIFPGSKVTRVTRRNAT